MELNEEDEAEIKALEKQSIDEQLVEACEHGAFGMAKSLYELGANISYHEKEDGLTALHYACLNGHCDIVKWLIELGADVNVTDTYGRTALHWAAYNGQIGAAQLLYDADAHVMAKSPKGQTPYGFASNFNTGNDTVSHFFRRAVSRAPANIPIDKPEVLQQAPRRV
jgi:ankyrin repeat protein